VLKVYISGNMSQEETMANVLTGGATLTPTQREGIIVHIRGDSVIHINKVDVEAPWRWLEAGWHDFTYMPFVSLSYGAVFALVAAGLMFGLAYIEMQSLIVALAGGFLLIGPFLAVGLYEAARRRATGEEITTGAVFLAGFRAPGQLALLGLLLMFIYMVWVELAFVMFMLYFGVQGFPPVAELIPNLLYTWKGLTLLISGTVVGIALAATVFTISAISAPMLTRRRVGIATAILASVKAVQLNLRPMLLWAALIFVLMIIGFGTLFVGLLMVFPLIGYATWHAYCEIAGTKVAE
jgi:uncharacterized membrane protein